MIGVSIVVPVYNAFDYLRRCIASIYAVRTTTPFEVIVVNNGSDAEVGAWLTAQQRERPNLLVLQFEEPLGFARAVNEGMRRARCELLVLLNSDTEVSDGWLDQLAAALTDDPGLGIVSPVTNRCGHEVQADAESRALEAHDIARYAEQIRDRRELVEEPQRLAFFCVMLRRVLWEQLGGLDEVYRTGNFEDDDFCLRTRLAGYRLAVLRSVFVFHNQGRTFNENHIRHAELLASNGAIFMDRARRWSTQWRRRFETVSRGEAVSVILTVSSQRSAGLRDSLVSLANQTICGFEVVVVHPESIDIREVLSDFAKTLLIKELTVSSQSEITADLLNAAFAAASRTAVAYLASGDIYHPYHLEILLNTLEKEGTQAAHTAWSVLSLRSERTRRESVQFHDAQPGLALGDWAPLPCWMHRRSAVKGDAPFDIDAGSFCGWAFVLEHMARLQPRYVCRVTCERPPEAPHATDESYALRVMDRFPVKSAWEQSQRDRFLAGVRNGPWEERLVLERNEMMRRARRMMQPAVPVRPDGRALSQLRERLSEATSQIVSTPRHLSQPDVILFNIISWTALTQRPHHFARGLAAKGHRVFWVDVDLKEPGTTDSGTLLRELEPNILQVELPACATTIYRLRWSAELIDTMTAAFAHIRAACGISTAVQVVNFPRWQPLTSDLHRMFGWPIVYDCLDDQGAFAELYGHELGATETNLIRESSGVIASSRTLLESLQQERPDAVLIENAVDFELFHQSASAGLLDDLPHPIVGFFGAFANWLDLDWIEQSATHFPEWSFVYVGEEGFATSPPRQRWKQIAAMTNVHVFAKAEPLTLTQYLAQFDLCVMPFQDLPITRGMNAVKIYEYLAAGKPVLAADLAETRPFADAGLITVYRDAQGSFQQMKDLVAAGSEESLIKQRTAFAAENSWNDRIAALRIALQAAIHRVSPR